MPTNKTQWMNARSVVVEGAAIPDLIRDGDGVGNTVAAIRIQRTSGVGALIIEGRPEDLMRVADEILAAATEIYEQTEASPALRSIYGRA